MAEYAYEYVYKQEIVSIVKCLDFSDEDTQKLLSYKYPLNLLFEEWMRCDAVGTDALWDCILDTAENI